MLKVRATKVGQDTFISQVIKLVEECQGSKVPIQEFADRVTSYFVPAVLGLAAVAFVLWLVVPDTIKVVSLWAQLFLPWVNPNLGVVTLAIFALVATLVIACPCALGLATPVALSVGLARAARAGIFIKRADALEKLRRIDTVVLDKTGTLTEGRPGLVGVLTAEGFEESAVLQLAASLERASEHPLAAAIVKGAQDRGIELLPVTDFASETGKGVTGSVNGHRVALGNRALLSGFGLDPGRLPQRAKSARREGQTVLFVVIDDQAAGLLFVADPIKDSTPEAIRTLYRDGIVVVMLTGDNQTTAMAVANRLSIDRVEAEVLPERKAEIVRQLQSEGRIVAMAGDGINDAPALAQAQVGIAMGTGTDVAMESAHVTLVKGDLRAIVRVEVPNKLSSEEADLLKRFAEGRGEEVGEPGTSLFSKIKSAFS